MNNIKIQKDITSHRSKVLPISWGTRDLSIIHLVFTLISLFVPAIMHIQGLPVRTILPMHWVVLLAGMLYGWRGGIIIGILTPISSFLLTGYPLPVKLLPMIFELVSYGTIAGLLREKSKLNDFVIVTLSLLTGRIVFILTILITGGYVSEGAFGTYLSAALMPGIVAGIMQIALIPTISRTTLSITKSINKKGNPD